MDVLLTQVAVGGGHFTAGIFPSILEGQNFNPFHVLSDAHLHLCVDVAEGSIVGILISI